MAKLNPYQRYLAEIEKEAKKQNTPVAPAAPVAPVAPKTPADIPAENTNTAPANSPANADSTPNKFKV